MRWTTSTPRPAWRTEVAEVWRTVALHRAERQDYDGTQRALRNHDILLDVQDLVVDRGRG